MTQTLTVHERINMTEALKTGGWNDSEVAAVIAAYDPEQSDKTVEKIVEDTGRSRRSVIGKLVSEGVYVAPEKAKSSKPKDEGPTKGEILTAIDKAGFDTSGLDGATKPALQRVLDLVSPSP